MAAEQAVRLTKDREVRVLQTKTIPQGISAMLMFDEEADAEENLMAMTQAAENVSTAQVTFAARDSEIEGVPVKQGEIMGLCNGKIRFVGTDKVEIAYKSTVKIFKRNQSSIITLIYGSDSSEEEAQELKSRLENKFGEDVEISVVDGGQPIYYFIISVE